MGVGEWAEEEEAEEEEEDQEEEEEEEAAEEVPDLADSVTVLPLR